MKVKDFYEGLSRLTASTELTLSPGPVTLKVNVQDALAARLLLWLEQEMSPDATQGDLDDVLDAAKWWATFNRSLPADLVSSLGQWTVTDQDDIALQVIQWIIDNTPLDVAGQCNVDDVLDAAKWWATFWAAMPH